MAGFAYYVIQRNGTINDSIFICHLALPIPPHTHTVTLSSPTPPRISGFPVVDEGLGGQEQLPQLDIQIVHLELILPIPLPLCTTVSVIVSIFASVLNTNL